jgi:hypothetical protein
MSAKTSARRIEAFFTALAATGNQTIAAERAKVSRSWVSLHRASDPAFRARMEGAVAAARGALLDRPANQPSEGWGDIAGEELVVRGTNGRRVQVARAHVSQWSPALEARFLTALAACCNVKAACRAVGKSVASAYIHRNKWPLFLERWDAALETGYIKLETELIKNACLAPQRDGFDAGAPVMQMTAAQAIHLLHMHKHRMHGLGKRPGLRARTRSLEEVLPGILRKLAPFANYEEPTWEGDGEACEATG